MSTNNLSFTITAKNNASPALQSLQKQVSALKSGIESLGSGTSSSLKTASTNVSLLSKTVSGVSSAFQNAGSQVLNFINRFIGLRSLYAITDSLSEGISSAFERLDTMDLFEQKMTMITGSAENASNALEQLRQSTKGTPYALDVAAKSVQNFVTRGMETQSAVDSVNIWMDAVSAYGNGTNDQLESVLDAIAKMRTKGTVEMRYLNRLFAAGINPVQMYAKATGMAAEDVQTALSEKEIRTEEFLNVVETAMREGTNGVLVVEGAARRLATTWAATFANMKIAIVRGWTEVITALNDAFKVFNENGLKGIVADYGVAMENMLGKLADFINATLPPILEKLKVLAEFWTNNVVPAFRTGSDIIKAKIAEVKEFFSPLKEYLTNLFSANPEEAMTPAQNAIQTVKEGYQQLKETVTGYFKAVREAAQAGEGEKAQFSFDLDPVVLEVANAINMMLVSINNNVESVMNSFRRMGSAVWTGLKAIASMLASIVGHLVIWTARMASFVIPPMFEFFSEVLGDIAAALDYGNTKLKEFSDNVFSVVLDRMGAYADRLTASIVNLIAKVRDLYTQFKNSGGIDAIVDGFRAIRDTVRSASSSMVEFFREVKGKADVPMPGQDLPTPESQFTMADYVGKGVTIFQNVLRTFTRAIKSFQPVYIAFIELFKRPVGQSGATNPVMSVLDLIERLTRTLSNIIPRITGLVAGFAAKVIGYIRPVGQFLWRLLDTFLVPLVDSVGRAFVALGNAISPMASAFLEALGKMASVVVPAVLVSLINIFNWIADHADFVVKAILSIGAAFLAWKTVIFANTAMKAFHDVATKTVLPVLRTLFAGFYNLTTFLGKTFIPMIWNVTKSVGTGLAGGIGKIGGLLGKIGGGLFSKIGGLFSGFQVPTFFQGMGTAAVQVGQGFMSLLTTMGPLILNLGTLAIAAAAVVAVLGLLNKDNKISQGITEFFGNFNGWLDVLSEKLSVTVPTMIQGFVTKIQEALPTLIPQGVNLILSIVNGMLEALPRIVGIGFTIIVHLIGGIAQILPDLVKWGFKAIGMFVVGIIRNFPNILRAVGQMLLTMAKGILYNLPIIVTSGIRLVGAFIEGIGSMVTEVGKAIADFVFESIQWVVTHPMEILEAIGNVAKTLWDAFVGGLFAAADSVPWLAKVLEGMGMTRPEEYKSSGQESGSNWMQGAEESLDQGFDWDSVWNKFNVDLSPQGLESGMDFTSGLNLGMTELPVDMAPVMEGIDMGDMGALGNQESMDFTGGMSEGMLAGTEMVTGSVAEMTGLTMGTLNSTLTGEPAYQAGNEFVSTFNRGFNENASSTYQAVAVFVNNVVTQLSAGFASNELVPMAIATAMSEVVRKVSADVEVICETIKTQLSTAKTDADTTTLELSLAIQNHFEAAKISVNASLQQMKTDISTKYEEIKTAIDEKLTLIDGIQTNFSTNAMDSFRDNIDQRLGETESDYQRFVDNVKAKLDDLENYHIQTANDMMNGLRDGIVNNTNTVTDATSELVLRIKEKFEEGLGIHSPSQYGYWLGEMLAAGIINGLSGSKLAQFVDSVIGDMKTAFENGEYGEANADQLVNYLNDDATLKLIGKVADLDVTAQAPSVGVPGIIQAAQQHIGYTSSGEDSVFGRRFGGAGAWCAYFVRAMAEDAGVPFPATGYVPTVKDWAINEGRWTQTPQSGYAVIFDWTGAGMGSHIGLVESVNGPGNITTIEGNTGEPPGVYRKQRGSNILGYVALDGGHGVGLSLNSVLQNAYNRKHGIAVSGVAGGNVPYDVSAGTQQWAPLVLEALNMLGQPSSLLGAVLATIEKESTGNPNALNDWDSNWYKGTPSKGLMQVIDPTFAAYAVPGHNTNIWDPLSNILASLNYQLHRYGGIEARLSGYAVGTRYVPYDMPAMIHEGEAIIPKSQNPYTNSGGDYLADMFRGAFGESGINGLGMSNTSMKSSESAYSDNSTKNVTMNVYVNKDADGDRFVGNLEKELHRILSDGRAANAI